MAGVTVNTARFIMPNYQNGKIYAIRSHQTDKIYIGSTSQALSTRFGTHRRFFSSWKNGSRHYTTSYEILENDDCYIELLENYPCNDKNELRRREGELIRAMNCINKNIAGRTQKEYYNDNREEIIACQIEYYNDNKQKRKDYQKQYYNNNKEKIKNLSKEKHACECGGKYTTCNKTQHLNTKKHVEFMRNKNL